MYRSLLLILISSLLFCFLLVVAVLCPFVISLPPVLTLSPLLLYFLLFLLSSSHVIFSGTPPPTLPFLLSSLYLYLSSVLSALRQLSAITLLHLLIPVLMQPNTHSCLISVHCSHTHAHARTCRLHKSPRGCEEPSVSTLSHPLTVQENALCKRTGSINLPDALAYNLMLFW